MNSQYSLSLRFVHSKQLVLGQQINLLREQQNTPRLSHCFIQTSSPQIETRRQKQIKHDTRKKIELTDPIRVININIRAMVHFPPSTKIANKLQKFSQSSL